MKILSKIDVCSKAFNSFFLTKSSAFNKSSVYPVDRISISLTPIKFGLLLSITQPSGDIDVSHDVNAYKASIDLSGDTLDGK